MDAFRIELHVHTSASHDSLMGRHALLAVCRARGIDCIAITDHNEVSGALAFGHWLGLRGVSVIVGEEVMTSEGEVIGLFLTERVPAGMSPEDTVRAIRAQGGVTYVPHPFDEKRRRTVLNREALRRIAPEVDLVEVHNGRNVSASYDAEQRRAYEEVKQMNPGVLPVVGGDSHCFFEVGRNAGVIDGPPTRESFLRLMRDARFKSRKCHPLAHAATRLVRLAKMLGRGDLDAVCRAFHRRFARQKP